MAELLINIFNVQAVRRIVADASRELHTLELLPRAKHIASALRTHLSQDVPHALDVIVRCLPTPPDVEENHEFSSFLYMPFNIYVAENGLQHFDDAMLANLELTQRFTSEFSIRPFLMQQQDRTLRLLHEWTTHSSHHVRRSVANNLNDIGKDNPDVLYATAASWLKNADENRSWVVSHALRSSIKRGEMEAFKVLGFDKQAEVAIQNITIDPPHGSIGSSVCVSFSVASTTPATQDLLVDIAVHFVKSNGTTSPKVFKLSRITLGTGESRFFKKTVSLKQHTTRTHYPGQHHIEVLVNGKVHGAGGFVVSSTVTP